MKKAVVGLVLGVMLSGCMGMVNSRTELMTEPGARLVWQVQAPTDKVFLAYKTFLEEHAVKEFVTSNRGVEVEYFGSAAEITVFYGQPPMGSDYEMFIDLRQKSGYTQVQIWSMYNDDADYLQRLLPTKVVSEVVGAPASSWYEGSETAHADW